MMSFAERYGPWAVIAGASEGTGCEFARQVAAQGINLILVARREGPLAELADEIRSAHGVECITAAVDLTRPDAADQIAKAAEGREVGLYISNAGSDTNGALFLDKGVDAWLDLATLNALTPLRCCHHFGKAMRERGRGGILLVGSGACYGSGPHMATYSGSKAFALCFAEGLWAELEPHGVDVLFYALNRTDTPALRTLLAEKGMPVPQDLADPVEVARTGLERLPFGPVANWGVPDDVVGPGGSSAAQRRQRVQMVTQASRAIFGKG
jgi:short-subunit dehydrogenase